MKKLLFAAGILALAAVAAVFWFRDRPALRQAEQAPPASAEAAVNLTAPPFSLVDTSGNRVNSSQFQGKATVINFFASWCPPCREEIPGFVEVYDKYRGRGLELVGISFDSDTKEHLPAFMMQNRIGYRILMGDTATARAYGVNPIPATFFVGKDGRIKYVHVGFMEKDDFEREVRKLL